MIESRSTSTPSYDRRRAFFFTVNPLGSQEDGGEKRGRLHRGKPAGRNHRQEPRLYLGVEGRLTDSGYVVEIRVPFKSLRYPGMVLNGGA